MRATDNQNVCPRMEGMEPRPPNKWDRFFGVLGTYVKSNMLNFQFLFLKDVKCPTGKF